MIEALSAADPLSQLSYICLGVVMSKVLISNLIDEINILLSRPVGSVSRKASSDTIHQREQLKQLRSHLEGLTDDSQLGNLDQQYRALVSRLQGHSNFGDLQSVSTIAESEVFSDVFGGNSTADNLRTDKLEILTPISVSNIFGADSNLSMENSTMADGTPDLNSAFVTDRMIAALQQAIQQTLQQVVKESVQTSIQQAVSQTLAVERALMVGELSSNLTKIVEAQQRSQISQELITLNQQKQKLSAEISQLETDRANWMQQFQEFQSAHQDSLDRSLRSVDSYLRDQLSDTLQQTVQLTVQQTVTGDGNNPSAATLQEDLLTSKLQEQTDRFLGQLDEMFNSTFRSLEQDIQEYQTSITAKLGHMETLEQQGQALINALAERVNQQSENTSENVSPDPVQETATVLLPELPDDIPREYLDLVIEPADENLISSLLAGNEFGETIHPEPAMEETPVEVFAGEINNFESDVESGFEGSDRLSRDLTANLNPFATDESSPELNDIASPEAAIAITEIESILGAPSEMLFEDNLEHPPSADNDQYDSGALDFIGLDDEDNSIITDQSSAQAAHALNPDFDLEAATQIVERFDRSMFESPLEANLPTDTEDLPSLEMPIPLDLADTQEAATDSSELLRWLDSRDHQASTNIAEVSADEELMSWLGQEGLDMALLNQERSLESRDDLGAKPVESLESDNDNIFSALVIERDSNIADQSPTIENNADAKLAERIGQVFHGSGTDQAEDSEESLILLSAKDYDDFGAMEWEDSLLDDLNSDLERLESGVGTDPLIVANLDQFIRNTPYALTNWDTDESQAYPTIIEVSAESSQTTSPKSAIAQNPALDSAPASKEEVIEQASEIPEIFDHPESLFEDESSGAESPTPLAAAKDNSDDMDAIFAEVIADNLAKRSPTPVSTNIDELDQLFTPSPLLNAAESEMETLLYELELATEIEDTSKSEASQNLNRESDTVMQWENQDNLNELDLGANTLEESLSFDQPLDLPQNINASLDEDFDSLDTILQGFNQSADDSQFTAPKSSAKSAKHDKVDVTSFADLDELVTVLEFPKAQQQPDQSNDSDNFVIPASEQEDWSVALERLESKLGNGDISEIDSISNLINQPSIPQKQNAAELSADEFFASLEYEKLNSFANSPESKNKQAPDTASQKTTTSLSSNFSLSNAIADLGNDFNNELDDALDSGLEDDPDDLLLNQFADNQGGEQITSDWDSLLADLNAFNVNEPLLDDRRQKLGLSSVAPISDTLENVLDIDSLVMESRRNALIAPPSKPKVYVYNADDTWILGIDIGSTAIRASLFNAETNQVYTLKFDENDELLAQVVWSAHHDLHNLEDPMTKDIRVITKRSQNLEMEAGEVIFAQFKQFLKLGLPYRGVSAWQPIIQWSEGHQVSMRWLVAALKSLIEQIQTRANHSQLPDLGLILLNLKGVVFDYPTDWSDTYVLNVREAILQAGLVEQAEQVVAVEQAIAPIISLVHRQQISSEITLVIDVGALTTSLCLFRGIDCLDLKMIDRSRLHIRTLDYAGLSLSQDIVTQLIYPHWQMITNTHRQTCKIEHLELPEVGSSAPQQRILLQQYLWSSQAGKLMLEMGDRVQANFGEDSNLDTWNAEIMGQPILVIRRELENLILQPLMQRLNRELNMILTNVGVFGEDVQQVKLLGNMRVPLLRRWLAQKLPNAQIEHLETSMLADGLAAAPLYPQLQDVARQQYSDYFLLQEICRLNLHKPITATQLLKQLQMRGVNIKTCRDRLLSLLQGELPAGLFPWQEPEHSVVLEDPTLSSDLFAGRLFELETDGTYQPNVIKFQQLRIYLQAITSNMRQTLNEPLVFPELGVIK